MTISQVAILTSWPGPRIEMRHIVYVVSGVEESRSLEWTARYLRDFYRLTFVILNPGLTRFEKEISDLGIYTLRIPYRRISDLPLACLRILRYFLSERTDVVHCHLQIAQLAGLSAAWLARIPRRIYTRHTSTFHHVYHRKGIFYDRFSNLLASSVVSISQATDYALRILEKVKPSKIRNIAHGFDLSYFSDVTAERVAEVRKRWEIPASRPVVGVVSRFIEWKGIQFIIPAFAEFLKSTPSACLVLANASGPFKAQLMQLLRILPDHSYRLITFESDSGAMYHCFDILVHVPVDARCEAFGQVYIEAMAAGLPSIITPSGIAAQVAVHQKNAWLVGFKSSAAITGALSVLWHQEDIRLLLGKGARETSFRFSIQSFIADLRRLYDE